MKKSLLFFSLLPSLLLSLNGQAQTVLTPGTYIVPPSLQDNGAPTANNDAFQIDQVTEIIGDVSINDALSPDLPNMYYVTSEPDSGQVFLTVTGKFIFLPEAAGVTSFTYEITDVNDDISSAVVTLQVDADGSPPPAVDTTPNNFSFPSASDVAISTEVTSDYVTISGLGIGVAADATVSNGILIISGVDCNASCTVSNGDSIAIRLNSSSQAGTSTSSTLSIGASFTTTFTITTAASSGPPGGSPLSGWVYVNNDASCDDGDSWHWQCSQTSWVPAADYQDAQYIAVCEPFASANSCPTTSRKWISVDNLNDSHHVKTCDIDPAPGTNRNACLSASGATEIFVQPGDSGSASIPTEQVSVLGLAFSDTTSSINGVTTVQNHFWAGMPDVNSDGLRDLFVGTHDSSVAPSAMYINNGDSTFSYYDPGVGNYSAAGTPRITSSYMWGDWYGTGTWSVYGHDADGGVSASYRNSAAAGSAPVYSKDFGCFGYIAPRCVPLDVTGDGDVELVVDNLDGTNRLIVNAATGTEEYASAGSGEWENTKEISVFDLDNDGYPEIVETGGLGYWDFDLVQDDWVWFGQVFDSVLANGVRHEVVLDYDADGDQDIFTALCEYQADGQMNTVLSVNNGNGTFSHQALNLGLECTAYHTNYANSLAGDLNLDGLPDVIICGQSHGENVTILLNNGSGFSVDSGIDFGGAQVGNVGKPWCGIGDYDLDGRIDLVKTHQDTSLGLFRNTTDTDNGWMIVRVNGATSDGLHTRLYFREPSAGNIISSYEVGAFNIKQQQLIVHAGLGQHASVDVEVCWPHGAGCDIHQNVAANQVMTASPGSLN